jgi:type II secretory pathway component PulF
MPFYRVWALDEHNQTHTNVTMGNSVGHVIENLTEFNRKPLKIRQLYHWSVFSFTDIDRFEICHSLSELLSAGITLGDALEALSIDQHNFRRRTLCSTFAERIRFGCGMNSFKQKEFFDETAFQTLLRAEQTGNLVVVFRTLSNYYQSRHDSRQELYQIIRYPIFLAITLCILITIISLLVLPNLETIVPLKSQGFAYTSFKWFGENVDFLGIALVFLGIGLILCKPFFYRIPLVGRIYMGKFWHDLGFCLKHNISLIEALDLTSKSQPLFFQKFIQMSLEKLLNGQSLLDALDTLPAHSQTRSSFLALAQKTGDIIGIIDHFSKIEEKFLNNLIKKLLSWTQPLLLFIMGLVVLWILQATIVPLYDNLAEFKD